MVNIRRSESAGIHDRRRGVSRFPFRLTFKPRLRLKLRPRFRLILNLPVSSEVQTQNGHPVLNLLSPRVLLFLDCSGSHGTVNIFPFFMRAYE